MTIVETFADFCVAVERFIWENSHRQWRAGQSAFNLLARVRPDLAGMITGSDFDPFNNDTALPAFYGYLARHWSD